MFFYVCLRKLNIAPENAFCVSREFLYSPNDTPLVGFIFGSSKHSVGIGNGSVFRARNFEFNISCEHSTIKDRLKLNSVFYAFSVFCDHRSDFEGQVDVFGDSISHELERTIRRNERNSPFFVEFGQFYALVELYVIYCDTLVVCAWLFLFFVH